MWSAFLPEIPGIPFCSYLLAYSLPCEKVTFHTRLSCDFFSGCCILLPLTCGWWWQDLPGAAPTLMGAGQCLTGVGFSGQLCDLDAPHGVRTGRHQEMWEPGQVLTQLVLGELGPAQGDWLCRPCARLCLSCGWDMESVRPTSVPCAHNRHCYSPGHPSAQLGRAVTCSGCLLVFMNPPNGGSGSSPVSLPPWMPCSRSASCGGVFCEALQAYDLLPFGNFYLLPRVNIYKS